MAISKIEQSIVSKLIQEAEESSNLFFKARKLLLTKGTQTDELDEVNLVELDATAFQIHKVK